MKAVTRDKPEQNYYFDSAVAHSSAEHFSVFQLNIFGVFQFGSVSLRSSTSFGTVAGSCFFAVKL